MLITAMVIRAQNLGLNESPSEQEGKSRPVSFQFIPPSLNESPSEKEGKSRTVTPPTGPVKSLNESPSEKEGKCTQPVPPS